MRRAVGVGMCMGLVAISGCDGLDSDPRSEPQAKPDAQAAPPSTAGASEPAEPVEQVGSEPELAFAAERVGRLRDARLRESSGLAASIRNPGLFWTVNDSGGASELFLIGPPAERPGRGDMAVVATAGLDVRLRDCEALASFEAEGRAWLLVADVGDNMRDQRAVRLWVFEEPTVHTHTSTDANANTDAVAASAEPIRLRCRGELRLTYADGPRDCEAVAVDAASGLILLASKEIDHRGRFYGQAGLYITPIDGLWVDAAAGSDTGPGAQPEVRVLDRVTDLPTVIATGMSVSPDGRFLALANYGDGLYAEQPAAGWRALDRFENLPLPPRRQGESIAFGRDGRSLWLTAEGVGEPVWRVSFDPRP